MEKDRIDLLKVMLQDVDQALDRAQLQDTAGDRRNLMRTIISAAEAVSWVFRGHVLAIARELEDPDPLVELAFAEASFSVSERGEIIEQARYVSLTAMIRLIVRVAQSIRSDLEVDFGTNGWQSLKSAIQARNRITHPKSAADLTITDAEVEMARAGFFWLLDMTAYVSEEVLKELAFSAMITREVVDDLIAGDPDTLALYHRVHRELDE